MDIHAWLSNQYSLSSSSAVSLPAAIRADSPLLGFPSSDLSSDDPLLYPAPNYARDQPRTDDPDRDIAIKCLIHDMNSWHVFHSRDKVCRDHFRTQTSSYSDHKPLPPPPIHLISSEQSPPDPTSSPSNLQLLPQPSPLPPSASPTRRSSRFPSIASAVALGLGSEYRKAVYIPSPDDIIDSPVDSEPDLKNTLAPSSSPVSTTLTTPGLSPITSPAMSPTATSFSGHDSYQDEKYSRSPSRRPSQVILSPRDPGLSRKASQNALSLSRDNSLRSSHSPFVSTQLSRKPSCSQLSHSPKPSSPTPSLYLSRKSSAQFFSTNSLSPKNSHSRLSHSYTRGTTSFSATTSQVFLGSDGRPVEREKDWDATVTHDHRTRRPSAATDDLFTPPSPSISTFSHISHSSTSASASPQIAFHSVRSPTSLLCSPSNAECTTKTTLSPDYMTNPPPPSPPLTPTTVSQTALQTDLCPHSDPDLRDSLDGPNASRSRWSLTSSLLDAPSPTPLSPQFTNPFSSLKEGRAHVKSKSSASSPENSTPKDLSLLGKDDGDKPKSKGKGRMGTKRARLVSFISRFGGAQGATLTSPTLASTPSVPTTGMVDVPASTTTSSLPTPLTLVTDGVADKVNDEPDVVIPGSGSSAARTSLLTSLAMAFPTPPVGGGSVPTSPMNSGEAAQWIGSVPSSPTSFSGLVMGVARGGSVPSSPSVPAFPHFDDVGDASTGKASLRGRGRASTLSVGSGSRVSSGLSLAGIIGGSKRKLVVSGIGKEDLRGYDAVRAWCESFGEVRHISRKPNGDMHIDFRKSSVADTVCRVQAQVHIKGAGSVCLSWYTKK